MPHKFARKGCRVTNLSTCYESPRQRVDVTDWLSLASVKLMVASLFFRFSDYSIFDQPYALSSF